ncbi:hypothetical protein GETHPA_07260 [Geothrix rubra]|uniref:Sortilin N-terminal domain-containing protein n=1 Tax=Geothrix rubra TaxID=2927977 RepID=A0ABQ5Q3V0_9BACT|nr:hypothetical protein [Geothrix rubra]GLH69193.1 hypothetical protein GETHPA_07260 [Geothrix rubra]
MPARIPRLLSALFICASLLAGQKAKAPVPAPKPQGPAVDAARLAALKARSIGPAVMGGRVSDLAADPVHPDTFYVGLATGGVWKTVNAGATFAPIFDKQSVASIGAVAVAPSDPKVVWVGTGEANDRNSSGWGDGVYRSTDAGATWTHVGLAHSKAIPRVVVSPKDPATAYVAVMGDLWTPGGERGLFKTTDGGKTWKAVLKAPGALDTRVGCGDVAMDPANPDTLYAALYARQRTPWSFTYGAAASDGQDVGGIYRSTDGGATWHKLTKGLPTLTGRIGLDVSRSNPKVVMAVVQSDQGGTAGIDDVLSKAGGVFRSEDGGESWTRMNALNPRPFYFSQIRIDPVNPQRVYVAGYMLHVSDDGGRTFREDLFKHVHPDCHALAFPKADPPKAEVPKAGEPAHPPVTSRLLLGTDGGVYQSYEAGQNWIHLDHLPAGEFYRITLDDSTPYRIAGGLQDNENWVGPSRTLSKEGIRNTDWTPIGGGDGFSCVFDPQDPNLLYAESQGGSLHRFNLRTGEFKPLQPSPAEGQPAFRFNWNAPLFGSRHDKGVLYLGGNRVFRLTDHGEKWTLISPDLSTQDPGKTTATGSGAETFGVVFALAESPARAGLLWAGTDDGKLWITEDDGAHWTDLTAHVPAPARGQWISRIEPGARDAKVAYLAVDAHRAGLYAPLVYRTADGGLTWQSLAANLPPDVPVKVVREDPANPDLLFAGTEAGLYASLDRGASWSKFGGLPPVAVDDIQIQPREHDLVLATHGRSLYVLDDIAPLEALTPETAAKPLDLFPVRPAEGSYLLNGWVESAGAGHYRGANPPEGALLTYWLRDLGDETPSLSIANAEGQPVATFTLPRTPGLGRVAWNLRPTGNLLTPYGGLGAHKFIPSGTYTATLTLGAAKAQQKFQVTIAPGIETR